MLRIRRRRVAAAPSCCGDCEKRDHRAAARRQRKPLRRGGWRNPLQLPDGRPQVTDNSGASNFTVTIGAAGGDHGTAPRPGFAFYAASHGELKFRVRIAPDGSPDELWSSRDDVIYSLAFRPPGGAPGNRQSGRRARTRRQPGIFAAREADSHQVTSMASGPGGKLFLAAANPGKIFVLGPGDEPEGTFESQPFDAHIFSRCGTHEVVGRKCDAIKAAGGARIEFLRARETPPSRNNWSRGPDRIRTSREIAGLSAGAFHAMESGASRRHKRPCLLKLIR